MLIVKILGLMPMAGVPMLIFDAVIDKIHKSILPEGICLRIFDAIFMSEDVIDLVFMRLKIAVSADDLLLGRLFLLPTESPIEPLLRGLASTHREECVSLDLENIATHQVDEFIRNAVDSATAPILLGEGIEVIKILVVSVNKRDLAGQILKIL